MIQFPNVKRIVLDPAVMGGKPCIKGTRVTVGTLMGLLPSGADIAGILELYPYLVAEDVMAALASASWRSEERELPLTV